MINIVNLRIMSPEIVIIFTALTILLLDLMIKKKAVIVVVGIIGVLMAVFVNYNLIAHGWIGESLQGMFVFDLYSNFFKLIFFINLLLVIFISFRYMVIEGVSLGEYYALLFFATSGMMLMAGAIDLISLYLGLELMALSTYILAGIMRRDPRSNEAALKYFFLGAFSSAILLYGISLAYGLTGSTNLAEIAASLQELDLVQSPMALLSLIFLIVAFGFKIALVPFHMWAPDVYEGAPTSITAFMSIGPKAAGFAVMGRVLFGAFGDLHVEWSFVLMILAVLTMAVGSILAIAQTNIKRMLAYSSIAHAGYALLGVIAGTSGGLSSMMNYLFIYAFMNIGAFTVVILMRRDGFRGEELEDYAGLAKNHPLVAALMLIFMFSLTGIPPTAGFMAKFYVFMEAVRSGHVILVVIAALFSAVSAFFYLRVVMYMYMKEPKGDYPLSTSAFAGIALAITALLVILLGIFPSILLTFADISVP